MISLQFLPSRENKINRIAIPAITSTENPLENPKNRTPFFSHSLVSPLAMASEQEQLTEYERRRLENIKRNEQMIAALNIHSRLSDLSTASKRLRVEENKTYQQKAEKKPKSETPIIIRRSLRAQGMPPDSSGLSPDFNEQLVAKSKPFKIPVKSTPTVLAPLSMSETYQGHGSDRALLVKLSSSDRAPVKMERMQLDHPTDVKSLRLEPENIARVVPGRILVVRFFPTTNMKLVVAGNKYGNLGFWNVKPENEDEHGIYLYQPHSAPVSGISLHPFSPYKMYTSDYDGLLRLMDTEKEVFDLVYSSSSGSALFSLSQQPNDANSIYFGEGQGDLNMLDTRVGKISSSWSLHEGRINSVDFSSANTNILATSSTDGLACLWDLRKMDMKHPKSKTLQTVNHGRAVHSAYFSPSGSCLATTSLDDNVGVLWGANFEDLFMIRHDNWTNRWISSFRAVWGWDNTHLYIGNMKRRVDVLSVAQRKIVYALESPLMSAIPCRYDAHPCIVGMLAGATSGGQVYIWTTS